MQRFLTFLFLACYMLTVSLSGAVIEKNNHNSAAIPLKEKYPEQRRKLPIFPKTNMKFVVTPKPHPVVDGNKQTIRMKKRPLMLHVTVKPRVVTTATTLLVSRKPLMKLRTFTIQSRANGKFSKIDKTERNVKHVKKAETPNTMSPNKTDPVMQISRDPITEVYLPEEIKTTVEKLIPLETDERPQQNEKDQKSEESVISENNAENFLSEEEQDRSEFIFLENSDVKLGASDMLDITSGQDFDEDFETTTDYEIKSNTMRVKRSKNVIEEENLASTVSSLKYTGRETRLIDNVYFKNINS